MTVTTLLLAFSAICTISLMVQNYRLRRELESCEHTLSFVKEALERLQNSAEERARTRALIAERSLELMLPDALGFYELDGIQFESLDRVREYLLADRNAHLFMRRNTTK